MVLFFLFFIFRRVTQNKGEEGEDECDKCTEDKECSNSITKWEIGLKREKKSGKTKIGLWCLFVVVV